MNALTSKFRPMTTIAVLLAASWSVACSAQPANTALSTEAQAAVERARKFISEQRGAPTAELRVSSVTEKTWSDSSLGCRQPGLSYAQMISKGYVVLLSEGSKTHEVHVAGNNAVECKQSLDDKDLRAPRAPVRATYLPELEKKAREDLAKQLGVNAAEIQVIQRVPKRWTEASLQCQNDPAGTAAEIGGFKLFLRHKMRTYTYHTDDRRVFACPAIAKE